MTASWMCVLNRFDSSIRRLASGDSDEAFLAHVYGEMLGRPPDVGALANGTRNLSLGFLRRNQVRNQIVSSFEYRAATPLRRFKTSLKDDPTPDAARSLAASPAEEIWLELSGPRVRSSASTRTAIC